MTDRVVRTVPVSAPTCVAAPAHPHHVATAYPDKTALQFMPSGRRVSYRELEKESNRNAHAMRALGLQPGELVAICLPNGPELMQAVSGAMRIGLYFTLLPIRGAAKDLAYVVRDSGARAVIAGAATAALEDLRDALTEPSSSAVPLYVHGIELAGCGSWDQLLAAQADTLPEACLPGREMLYSSGSTGRPKGVRKPMFTGAWDMPDPRNVALARTLDLDETATYLSTSPLYHSAPLRQLLAALGSGATNVVMERFDAELALRLIEQFQCTHSLWVPTMFQRMLRLDESVKRRYSTASMTHAVHGAAPCPIHVKEAMIAWWGEVFFEYYSGTEGIGATWINTAEWLEHKGSVGRPQQCVVHILDEQGEEVPPGVTGLVYFESPAEFRYWNDPDKTRASISAQGWKTFGDIGYVDAEGYLYLTDRRDFMLISGGVNIYPQEIEHGLLEHPAVADVAAFGVPDDDLGERLVAIVQLEPSYTPSAALADDLKAYCRTRMGAIKVPKEVRFLADFPRLDTGKLHKKRLREDFLRGADFAQLH